MATKTYPRGVPASEATVSVTRPAPKIYLLSMHHFSNGLLDNRLAPEFLTGALLPALEDIEREFYDNWHNGGEKEAALVITGEQKNNKFFSNGLDLAKVATCPNFFRDYYYKVVAKIMTFPMHTVAAINGHTFAGGLGIAMACNWRLMRSERAWCAMNEIDFGAPLPVGLTKLLTDVIPYQHFRRVAFEGHKHTAPDALAAGMVDVIVQGGGPETIKRAIEFAQTKTKHSVSGVLPQLKEIAYADTLELFKAGEGAGNPKTPAQKNQERFKALQAAAISAKL